jgi:hypothetical protein
MLYLEKLNGLLQNEKFRFEKMKKELRLEKYGKKLD